MLTVRNPQARRFYEGEALRGGWTVRQLERQIGSQFYERTALSKNKVAMLRKGQQQTPDDVLTPEEEIKGPFFFEFQNLKDEYSESDLEGALIAKLEAFLLELGGDVTDAEAMRAQLADLEARLAQVRCAPKDVLTDIERSSTWLHDKAFQADLARAPDLPHGGDDAHPA